MARRKKSRSKRRRSLPRAQRARPQTFHDRERYPVDWSPPRKRGSKPPRKQYRISVASDGAGYHYWVLDRSGKALAATSTRSYPSESSALSAARRAAKRHHEATLPDMVKERKARQRRRLPSALTKI